MEVHGTFYSGEVTLLQGNFFKVYAVDDALHFARLADKPYSEMGGPQKPNILLFGLAGVAASAVMKSAVVEPSMRMRQEMEARVDGLEPGSPEFMGLDARNFTLRAPDIATMRVSGRLGMAEKGKGRIGVMQYTLNDGRGGKLYLYETPSVRSVYPIGQIVKQVVPNAEVVI